MSEPVVPAPDARIVLSTFSTPDQAAQIARSLVEARLAACANIIPAIRSIYRWQGAIHDDTETLVIFKTTTTGLAALTAQLVALHPYDVPEVLAIPVVSGHPPYLAWLASTMASAAD